VLLTSEMNRSADTWDFWLDRPGAHVADVGNEPIGGHFIPVKTQVWFPQLLTSEMNRSADTAMCGEKTKLTVGC